MCDEQNAVGNHRTPGEITALQSTREVAPEIGENT
jgi:hypothetical protein